MIINKQPVSNRLPKTGMFLGRFQPLHKGHMEIIRLVLKDMDHLKIVIGSSQKSYENANPFTSNEREHMIKLVFDEEIQKNLISVYFVPDINCDDRYAEHLSGIIGSFDVVYAADNELTYRLFSVRYPVIRHDRIDDYSSTEIRRRINAHLSWKELVDPKVYDYIIHIDGHKRIRKECS
jgi:nicotinamide-nucleotide adenylyltransferase